jgi:transposase
VIGADEVSWRKGHSYVTLVSSHQAGRFVWGKACKDTATLDCFFDELGPQRSEATAAVGGYRGGLDELGSRVRQVR